jgi:hypothetical protein
MFEKFGCGDDKDLQNSVLSHNVWSYIPLEIATSLLDSNELQNCREKRTLLEIRNKRRGGQFYTLIVALANQWITPTRLLYESEYISPSVLFNVNELGKHLQPEIMIHVLSVKSKLDELLTHDGEWNTKEFNELFKKKITTDKEYLQEFSKIITKMFQTWLDEAKNNNKQTALAGFKDLTENMDRNIYEFKTFRNIPFYAIITEWCNALKYLVSVHE